MSFSDIKSLLKLINNPVINELEGIYVSVQIPVFFVWAVDMDMTDYSGYDDMLFQYFDYNLCMFWAINIKYYKYWKNLSKSNTNYMGLEYYFSRAMDKNGSNFYHTIKKKFKLSELFTEFSKNSFNVFYNKKDLIPMIIKYF